MPHVIKRLITLWQKKISVWRRKINEWMDEIASSGDTYWAAKKMRETSFDITATTLSKPPQKCRLFFISKSFWMGIQECDLKEKLLYTDFSRLLKNEYLCHSKTLSKCFIAPQKISCLSICKALFSYSPPRQSRTSKA